MIDTHPRMSRTTLARPIYEQLKWRSANGLLKEISYWVGLLMLERRSVLRLPQGKLFSARLRMRRPIWKKPEAVIRRRLKGLQPGELVRIGSANSVAT